jgi:hypothetical protein
MRLGNHLGSNDSERNIAHGTPSASSLGAKCAVFVAALAATSLVACAGEDSIATEDPGAIATAEAPLTSVALLGHAVSANSLGINLGTTSNRACFLAGIGGRLAMMQSVRHGARVYTSGGNWQLDLRTSGSAWIHAQTLCVTPNSGTSLNLTGEVNWSSGNPSTTVAAATSNRRCFLTRIDAAPGFNGTAFDQSTDKVTVLPSGSNWVLGGQTTHGKIEATARCIDVATPLSTHHGVAGSGNNLFPMEVIPNGVGACALQGIQAGLLATNNINDGVLMDFNDATDQWSMRINNGKHGFMACFR